MTADVLIIGGGLAGLLNAIQLNKVGLQVVVIEKKTYPFHRVCGEYISNEVLPFFDKLGLDVDCLNPSRITRLEITNAGGKRFNTQLDLGGFGVSRYTLDNYLYKTAHAAGVKFMQNMRVEDVRFVQDRFEVTIPGQTLTAPLVIGSYGKRSNLDQTLKRDFFYKRSPFLAVKFHIKADLPEDLIQLNNYKDGYCGVSKVDGDRWCMCYLAHRDDLRKYGSLQALEENVICKNPHLKKIFDTAEFLLDKPEVINEISFEKKAPVEHHILMSGDTAGMIAPLCGNGMAMAIHSSKLLSEAVVRNYLPGKFNAQHRDKMEQEYTQAWNKEFANRLWAGRQMHRLFGRDAVTGLTISMLNHVPLLANFLIRTSHGQPFA
ncbi:NAD(P)/FAD-dependent oxidoreductase [Mucilaginibacter myungsuensis]|uniref:NAD(P)/FAD-dependent oxidoreductase n=1 Tax=Mucilaginibacter myungsuensis TaxID=649104 RepID=A0A929KUS7_9SPHI|nr:NAD(P)/FAD-dependent oxidoreductase [Mucilaginibacter myungsuensis]MBE9661557.1 NAD(P)/FAD-dependent oxidoreductase [Mucilaginibacter myungsuensis]MDN3597700.1 NAD(P)/FAD-dependent oxidoreductase [Mucilaginibacter myungsuensis]